VYVIPPYARAMMPITIRTMPTIPAGFIATTYFDAIKRGGLIAVE